MSRTNRTYTAVPNRYFPESRYAKSRNNDGAKVPPRHGDTRRAVIAWTDGHADCAWNRGKRAFKRIRTSKERHARKRETFAVIADATF